MSSSYAPIFGIEEHELRLIFGRTRIEYGAEKEDVNRRDHQYSLESARWLLERWLMPTSQPLMVYKGPTKRKGEFRYEMMTIDDDKKTIVFFVITMRKDEFIRIISFRKASDVERTIYFSLAT